MDFQPSSRSSAEQFKQPANRFVRSNNYHHSTLDLPHISQHPQDVAKNKKATIKLQYLNTLNPTDRIEQEQIGGCPFQFKPLVSVQQEEIEEKKQTIKKVTSQSHDDLLNQIFKYSRHPQSNQTLYQQSFGSFLSPQNKDHNMEVLLNSAIEEIPDKKKRNLKLRSQQTLPSIEFVRFEMNQKKQQSMLFIPSIPPDPIGIIQSDAIQKKKKEFLIQKFSPSAQRKYKIESTCLYDQIGGESILKQLIDRHYVYIECDPLFDVWFGIHQNLEYLKSSFVRFLSYATGHNSFYMTESLRQKHCNMQLKTNHFDVFKYYLMRSFIDVTHSEQYLLRFSSAIEQYRFLLLNKNKQVCRVYNNQANEILEHEDDAIKNLAHSMYKQIQQDVIIGKYFEGVNIMNQAEKFGKIIKQLMNWDISAKGGELQQLRDFHRKFHLQDYHYIIFRQYLINSLRTMGFKDKEIYLISKRMDGYKCYILNRDSLQYLAQTHTAGKQFFLERYSKGLIKDPRMKTMLQKLGKDFFMKHCQLIYLYFCNQQTLSLNLKDIRLLHNMDPSNLVANKPENNCLPKIKKYLANEEETDAFIEHFISTCRALGMDEGTLDDYNETWDPIKQVILNRQPIGQKIGKEAIIELQKKITSRLDDREGLKKYFQHCEFDMKTVMGRVIYFLINDTKYYKKKDLRLIHERLKIQESSYENFIYLFDFEARKMGIKEEYLNELTGLFAEYKPYIVSKKDQNLRITDADFHKEFPAYKKDE